MEKKDLNDRINELLGAELNLLKLPKSQLEKLYEAVKKLREVEKKEEKAKISGLLGKPIKEIVDETLLGRKIGEMTLGELVKSILSEHGLFGFGIIPKLFRGIFGE